MTHTRCFAETSQDKVGNPYRSQLVGRLHIENGQVRLEDCDGKLIPLAMVMEKYKGKLVCVNFNNLEPVPGNFYHKDLHHDGN